MSLLLSLVEPLNYPALLEDAGVVSAWRTALLHLDSTHGFATPDRPPGVIMLLAHPDHELRTVVSCPSLKDADLPMHTVPSSEVGYALETSLLHLDPTHGKSTPDAPPGVSILLGHPDHEYQTVVRYTFSK